MEINLHDIKKMMSLSVLILALFGCAASDSSDRDDIEGFGFKTIFLDRDTSIVALKKVVDDWEDIKRAIYIYQPRDCIKKLSVESIRSLGVYSGAARGNHLRQKKILGLNDDAKVISLGTGNPCIADKHSSGPSWIILYSDDGYEVVDTISIEGR